MLKIFHISSARELPYVPLGLFPEDELYDSSLVPLVGGMKMDNNGYFSIFVPSGLKRSRKNDFLFIPAEGMTRYESVFFDFFSQDMEDMVFELREFRVFEDEVREFPVSMRSDGRIIRNKMRKLQIHQSDDEILKIAKDILTEVREDPFFSESSHQLELLILEGWLDERLLGSREGR